jgi:hypothetical protein
MRKLRCLLFLGVFLFAMASAPSALAVSGAGYTTVNPAVDGSNHCKNGNPGVNCNIYDGKEFVWLNGGPAANGLGPDGQYFFAVLEPGGQPNPNDGGPKNLSDDFDSVANRTFTVSGGEVSAYGGTHTYSPPLIRLFPYADTSNPGGVYIMAICSLGAGYPVAPRSCKYDAFKVRQGAGKVQTVLSGRKYLDSNLNGQHDTGEAGLAGWVIHITGSDGTAVDVVTDASGDWSWTSKEHSPTTGTTSYTVSEELKTGWMQTGNTVDQSVAAGGATVSLASFEYTVVVPNNAVSAASGLLFGNNAPPICPAPTFGTDEFGHTTFSFTAQDDNGLGNIVVTTQINSTVNIPPFFGVTTPIEITGTTIDQSQPAQVTTRIFDLGGAFSDCDPVMGSVRIGGRSIFTAVPQADRHVTGHNGTSGTARLTLIVNGRRYVMRNLRAGETRTIDIGRALRPGNRNRVIAIARGPSGGRITVGIWN